MHHFEFMNWFRFLISRTSYLLIYAVKEYQKMLFKQLMPVRSKKTINSGEILCVLKENRIITEQNKSHLYKWMDSHLPDFTWTLIILTSNYYLDVVDPNPVTQFYPVVYLSV